MFDFVSIGEILIDFTPNNELYTFKQNTGGAPANVASVLAKLGCNTAFVGKVGDDIFGRDCKKDLSSTGVNTDYLILSNKYPTTLAFVCLNESGNRDFAFYRDNTADINLTEDDINPSCYTDTKYFHFGSVSLTSEPSKTTVLNTVKKAKQNGCIISYDPNLRLPLWKSKSDAKENILNTLKYADLLKLSEEEAEFLFDEKDYKKVCQMIYEKYNLPIITITLADKGCYTLINGKVYTSKAYKLNTIDTTGAGDAFWAGILYNLIKLNKDLYKLQENEIKYMLNFANAIGSLVTTKKGAIPAIPELNEIIYCMENSAWII